MRARAIATSISRSTIFTLLIWVTTNLTGRTKNASDTSFPLEEGTYWVYQGFVRWWSFEVNQMSKTPVTWRMEVRKVIRRDHLLIAVVNGFPGDLDWSDGHPKPSHTLIIQSEADKYYLIGSDEDVAAALERVQDPNDLLEGLLQIDDLFLELPLVQGKKFCDPEQMVRPDNHYCWVVDSAAHAASSAIKGVPPGQRIAYRVRFVTNPDDTAFSFVTGVGLTAYEYHHHGSVADTELKLVEFHPGDDGPASSAPAHP